MRKLVAMVGALSMAAVTIMGAQQHGGQAHDADKMAAGGGSIPAGWAARLDNGSTTAEGVRFMTMGSGVHFISGPAGIYWKPDLTRSGTYTVSATFNQMEPAAHPEAYGLFIGGADLGGAGQKYTYFLVRQDGQYTIKRRQGAATPTIVDWTDSPAVKKTAAGSKGVNALAIAVAGGTARFSINGTEVKSVPAAQIDANGLVGLRINHNLNVHVEGFGVK
jgi:hypothetical protein